jgi:hypothetical protein
MTEEEAEAETEGEVEIEEAAVVAETEEIKKSYELRAMSYEPYHLNKKVYLLSLTGSQLKAHSSKLKENVTTEKNETSENAKGSHERRFKKRYNDFIWLLCIEGVGQSLDNRSPD